MTAAVLCILLVPPAAAEDRYWINWLVSPDWVEGPSDTGVNWMNSAGETGLPGPSDKALIVLPYPMGTGQPVLVNVVDPGLPSNNSVVVSSVIIESGNILTQQDKPYYSTRFPSGYNLNLTSDTEIIGGSGGSFTAPPGYFGGNPNPPPITPKGTHSQSAGTNTVNTQLILGNIAGSEGKYTLSGTGSLSVGFMEKIGSAGTGIFTQSAGSHTVGTDSMFGILILGEQAGSSGTYNLSGDSASTLTVRGQQIIGSAGTGTFTQSGGTHTTDLLMLGQQAPGRGTYDLRGGTLQVTGTNTLGKEGFGEFFQYSGSTHNAQYLTIGSEAGGTGTYNFYGGTLGVGQTFTVGKSGSGEFYHQGLVTKAALNAGNLVLAEQAGSVGTYTLNSGSLGSTPDLNVSNNMTIGRSGTGTFNHNSGWVSAGNLVLAEQAGSTGTYTLNAGSVGSTPDVNVANNMTIGRVGTGTFNQNNGWVQVGQTLNLGSDEAGNFGTGTYNLAGGRLTVRDTTGTGGTLYVGSGGNGFFNQTGGEVKIEGNGRLEIGGPYSSGSGTYSIIGGTLSTAATLSAAYVGVAAARPGLFRQDGYSAVTISQDLDVMYQPVGINGYFLGGYGDLSVKGNTLVDGYFFQGGGSMFKTETLEVNSSSTGDYRGNYEKIGGELLVKGRMQIGNGVFNQNSGDLPANWTDVNTLALGVTSNATGTFNLNYGTLDVRSEAIVGEAGSGVINHTAGTNTVWGDLILGKSQGGKGEYNLEGANSKLVVKGNEIIGSAGTGTFNQKSTSGREHEVNGNLFLGHETDNSVGKFTLDSGKLIVTGSLTVGAYGYGEFTQNGGEVLAGRLRVGDLREGNIIRDDQSIYTLSGNSTLEVLGNEDLGSNNSARFNQTGGSHTVRGNLVLAPTEQSGKVDYELSRGTLDVEGDLRMGHDVEIYQGYAGYARFTQTGGINNVHGDVIVIDKRDPSYGSPLSFYTLENDAKHFIGNELRVIGDSALYTLRPNSELNALRIVLQDKGLMWNEGTVRTTEIDNNGGSLRNFGTIETTGSTLRNYGIVTMEGTAPIIIGRIENYGTFRATNTAATYDGLFNNNGAYFSTGSSNRFNDLIVGTGGYLVGGAQDSFIIKGNFVNNSTQNTLWDTSLATLIFENALSHNVYLAGLDLGATANGFLDNFAWGSFSLTAGEELHLFDGNLATDGAALYLGLLTPLDLDDIYSAFNIYYNATLAGNAWLGNNRYALHDGGYLIPFLGGTEPPGPEPVPEPSMLLVWVSGLAMLGGMAWRRHRRG